MNLFVRSSRTSHVHPYVSLVSNIKVRTLCCFFELSLALMGPS